MGQSAESQQTEQHVVRDMVALGFEPEAADVYAYLLSHGAHSGDQLTEVGFNPAHVDVAVRRLMDAGLTSRGYLGELYASEPSLAWASKIADLVWSQDTSLDPMWRLPVTGDRRIDILRNRMESIRENAQRLYVEHLGLPQKAVRKARDTRTLEQLTTEAIGRARSEVRSISRSPRFEHVSLIWGAVTERIAAGISYRRLTDLHEMADHGLAIVRRDVYVTGVQLRLIDVKSINKSFYLVDRDLLVLKDTAGPALPPTRSGRRQRSARRRGGSVTRHKQIVRRYSDSFERLWEKGVPAQVILPAFRAAAERLLKRASESLSFAEAKWIHDLIRFGRFSKFATKNEWSEERLMAAFRQAEEKGLVERNALGETVPNYGIDDSLLSGLRPWEIQEWEEPPCTSCWEPRVNCACSE